MSEFSVRCRELRKNLAITLKEMSEDIGIPLSSISKYEQGIIKPGVDILSKIARVYKVNLNWLVANQGLMFESEELFLANGTDDSIRVRLVKYNNRVKLHPLSNEFFDKETDLKAISFTEPEKSIQSISKNMNRPVTVEFSDSKEVDTIKVFYPDGKIEVLDKEENSERSVLIKKIRTKLESASFDSSKLEFLNTAIDSLEDRNSFEKLKALVKGMEIAYK